MAKLYTYKQLQDEVLYWLDESVSSGVSSSTTLTNIKNSLQQAHLRRLTMRDWPFMLWPTPITFSTASGVQNYSLHSEFYKPFYMFNQTSKQYCIEVPARQLGPSGVRWNSDNGHMTRFAQWGRYPVQNQPASAGTISIVSSSSGDTGSAYGVTVQGTDSTGSYLISETINPTGTSTATGSKSFSNPITSITLAAAFAGTLTISRGATTLLVLQPGELGRSYPYIYSLSILNSVDVIEYRFYRQPKTLSSNNDIPDIPPPFQQILVWDALIDLAAYQTDITQKDLAVFGGRVAALEAQMIEAYDESLGLESEPRYVRYLGEEPDAPRIYTT